MAIKATWHVKLTRGDHARTAFTDYLNRVPKRGAIETVHVDGERVKLRIDVVHEQTHARAASLGVFDVLARQGRLSIREISNGPFCDNYNCR